MVGTLMPLGLSIKPCHLLWMFQSWSVRGLWVLHSGLEIGVGGDREAGFEGRRSETGVRESRNLDVTAPTGALLWLRASTDCLGPRTRQSARVPARVGACVCPQRQFPGASSAASCESAWRPPAEGPPPGTKGAGSRSGLQLPPVPVTTWAHLAASPCQANHWAVL